MPWKITFEGHEYRENDLTIGHMKRIEVILGERWRTIAPLASAHHAEAILRVMHAATTGEPEDAVTAKIDALTMDAFIAAVGVYDDDLPTVYEDGNPPMAAET